MFNDHEKDVSNGLKAAGYAFFLIWISPKLASLFFIGLAVYFAFSGIRILFSDNSGGRASGSQKRSTPPQETVSSSASAPVTSEPTIADMIKEINLKNNFKCSSCGGTVDPTDMKCRYCNSVLVDATNMPRPAVWAGIEVGQSVRFIHPVDGEITQPVKGRIYYGELWQEKMRPNVPWTLTGGYFVGLMLDNKYLLNWQSRFFLLDQTILLTDMEINRNFATPARQFGASNQTAKVHFDYRGTNWRMDDIGRFRVEYTDGENIKVSPGANGRFIHASSGNRILVVEDYQSGGQGLDSAWMGYELKETDIQY